MRAVPWSLRTHVSMKRLFISAAHKSSGKTTITLGLCRALVQQGLRVQAFKKGPDYIDPMWLAQASGNPCYNLDFNTMTHTEMRSMVFEKSRTADIALIEGNKGLYDGLDLDGSNSNAALATLLKSPVVLVLDARGMTRGIAPLILGYQAFDPAIKIAGVILNQLGGSRHEKKLRTVIEHYTDVQVIGAVHRHADLVLEERHLGLIPSNEAREASAYIDRIANILRQEVDLSIVQALAAHAPAMTPPAPESKAVTPQDIRIGIARDAAFGFYYSDDLDALAQAGAKLIPFSPIRDTQLPDVDALFIGGGFPETHMSQLEANLSMRDAVRKAVESGMPVYAECGGLMYLSRQITWRGDTRAMVGAIAADISMHDKPQGRGYIKLEPTPMHPWPQTAEIASPLQAHEFHYSSLTNVAPGFQYAYKIVRGTGLDGQHDGLIYKNTLACYAHLRDTSRYHWASGFVQFIRSYKTARGTPI